MVRSKLRLITKALTIEGKYTMDFTEEQLQILIHGMSGYDGKEQKIIHTMLTEKLAFLVELREMEDEDCLSCKL